MLSPNGRHNGDGRGGHVTVAVVGLGYWGPNLLRVLAEMPGVSIGAICDLDADRLHRFGRRHPGVLATTNLDDVLDDPGIDAVVIATPVFTHFDLAARSLAAGKHTFVEKPLAASADQADELAAMADEHGVALMCGLTFLYSPSVRAVKQLIDSGELGEIYFISSSRVNLGLHQRDVSVVWDLGPHDFSILLYWLEEEPELVTGIGRDSIVPGIPDVAFVDLRFPSGIVAHVELSWLSPSKLRRTVIVGSEKMVVYDDGAGEPIRIFDRGVVYHDPESFGQYQLSYRTGDIVSPKLDAWEPLALELDDFLTAVRSGTPARERLRLARDVVRIVERADAAIAASTVPPAEV